MKWIEKGNSLWKHEKPLWLSARCSNFQVAAGARLAQSVERKALNLVVVGLSPSVGVALWANSESQLCELTDHAPTPVLGFHVQFLGVRMGKWVTNGIQFDKHIFFWNWVHGNMLELLSFDQRYRMADFLPWSLWHACFLSAGSCQTRAWCKWENRKPKHFAWNSTVDSGNSNYRNCLVEFVNF